MNIFTTKYATLRLGHKFGGPVLTLVLECVKGASVSVVPRVKPGARMLAREAHGQRVCSIKCSFNLAAIFRESVDFTPNKTWTCSNRVHYASIRVHTPVCDIH